MSLTGTLDADESLETPEWVGAVQSMSCESCVTRPENTLSKVPGAERAIVSHATECAHVRILWEADLSRHMWSKIRSNLFWAFAYNVIGIPLTALGMLNPVIAGAAMTVSSVGVAGKARLLTCWRPRSEAAAGVKPDRATKGGLV
jgi:cation transport ATPase